jgi:hypothetical protein
LTEEGKAMGRRGGRVFGLGLVLLLVACQGKPSAAPEKGGPASPPKVVVEQETREREKPLPPEVKIRLKRDGKDNYTWELSGSDVEQDHKVNERLRKKLAGDQTK